MKLQETQFLTIKKSDKRAANCEYLNDASISQNDQKSNDDQWNLRETNEFGEEDEIEEENAGLVDIDDEALFLVGRVSGFGRAIKINWRFLK